MLVKGERLGGKQRPGFTPGTPARIGPGRSDLKTDPNSYGRLEYPTPMELDSVSVRGSAGALELPTQQLCTQSSGQQDRLQKLRTKMRTRGCAEGRLECQVCTDECGVVRYRNLEVRTATGQRCTHVPQPLAVQVKRP